MKPPLDHPLITLRSMLVHQGQHLECFEIYAVSDPTVDSCEQRWIFLWCGITTLIQINTTYLSYNSFCNPINAVKSTIHFIIGRLIHKLASWLLHICQSTPLFLSSSWVSIIDVCLGTHISIPYTILHLS